MRNLTLTSIVLVLAYYAVSAQSINVNLYSSYVFDDSFDSYYDASNYYDGKIKGGLQWGGGIEYMLRDDYGVELLYLRQDTNAPTQYLSQEWDPLDREVRRTNFDVGLNYILIGGTRHVRGAGPVEGFGGLMGGMVVASIKNPDNGRETTATKFAWGLRLGGIIWASDNVGIKLETQLLSAVQAMGGGVYFSNGGSGAGLSSYSTFYQFSLGGGLVFSFGD